MDNEVDLQALWKELDAYSKELELESKSLEDVWVKIAEIKAKNDSEALTLTSAEEFHFLDSAKPIGLNIGGQIFETDVATLTKDPYSILAACCRAKPVIEPSPEGIFYFNRDWWLFRHILAFLRSNILPNEIETLKELYTEASFWRLESLQVAIEGIPLSELSNHSPQIQVMWDGALESKEHNGLNSNNKY